MSEIPKGKKIKEVVLDTEYYSNELIEHLYGEKLWWSIAADKDKSVKDIKAIPDNEWKPFVTKDGISTDKVIAGTLHAMNKWNIASRLIILRWQDRQLELFKNSCHYHCITTNMVEESPQERAWAYNERAHIENNIKEIKYVFGMEKLPSGALVAMPSTLA